MNSNVFSTVCGAGGERSPSDRDIVGAADVYLYMDVVGEVTKVGTAVISNIGCADPQVPQTTLHGHPINSNGNDHLVVIRSTNIETKYGNIHYPFDISGPEDSPQTLSELYSAGLYVWDSRAMKSASESVNPTVTIDDDLEPVPALADPPAEEDGVIIEIDEEDETWDKMSKYLLLTLKIIVVRKCGSTITN